MIMVLLFMSMIAQNLDKNCVFQLWSHFLIWHTLLWSDCSVIKPGVHYDASISEWKQRKMYPVRLHGTKGWCFSLLLMITIIIIIIVPSRLLSLLTLPMLSVMWMSYVYVYLMSHAWLHSFVPSLVFCYSYPSNVEFGHLPWWRASCSKARLNVGVNADETKQIKIRASTIPT